MTMPIVTQTILATIREVGYHIDMNGDMKTGVTALTTGP